MKVKSRNCTNLKMLGSEPTADISHKKGGKLPLCLTRPAVIFLARQHYRH